MRKTVMTVEALDNGAKRLRLYRVQDGQEALTGTILQPAGCRLYFAEPFDEIRPHWQET